MAVLKACAAMQEHQKKTLNPTWNEDKWLLVQEPKTQAMRVQMFDHDVMNLKVHTVQYLCCTSVCLSVSILSSGLPHLLYAPSHKAALHPHQAAMRRTFILQGNSLEIWLR